MRQQGVKRCTRCKLSKPISDFRIRTRKTPRPRARCKLCEAIDASEHRQALPANLRNAATRAWERRNPEMYREQLWRRNIVILGLKDQQHEIIARLRKQPFCDICQEIPQLPNKLCIDHDHTTGMFRGLLCYDCNFGLGKFKDSPQRLFAALKYISKMEPLT